jgi:DNA processing protein
LIQQGAKLVATAQDILEEYGMCTTAVEREPVLTAEETVVLQCLTYDAPTDVEYIVTKSLLPLSVVTYLLLQMELRGLVVEHSGQRYIRSSRGGVL